MAIDWITVSAQIVNFLILVGLLKHFLYQPVLRAMDRREQRVADRLNAAEAREQRAEESGARYEEKLGELERRKETVLAEAIQGAERRQKELLSEARAEVDRLRTNWLGQVRQEKEEFLTNLRRESAQVIQVALRKALRDLADSELEERVSHTFIAHMKALDEETRQALASTADSMRIASAFELSSPVRELLTEAIHEHLADGIEVEFRELPELSCGIELSSGGRRLSWNLDSYLDELSGRVGEFIEQAERGA